MEELANGLETASFESVFMSHKLKPPRRVSFGATSTSTLPSREPTPNYASAAKKSPPLQYSSPAVDSTTPNAGHLKPQVFTNASGQRVDQRLTYSSKENVDKLKRRKLCNKFHLLGSCIYGECTHKHGPALSPQDIADLTYIARLSVCPNGIFCKDEKCICGHRCPFTNCSGFNCKFPESMHGVDTTIAPPLA